MAKKKVNTENTANNVNTEMLLDSPKIDNNVTIIDNEGVIKNAVLVSEKEMINKSNKISNICLVDLISLEKACALVCKRYETIAKLDMANNNKFKEYKEYYENIFHELERRVENACK